MKITIAYRADETPAAQAVAADIRRLLPAVKVRESDRHPPFKHVYMTVKNPHDSGSQA